MVSGGKQISPAVEFWPARLVCTMTRLVAGLIATRLVAALLFFTHDVVFRALGAVRRVDDAPESVWTGVLTVFDFRTPSWAEMPCETKASASAATISIAANPRRHSLLVPFIAPRSFSRMRHIRLSNQSGRRVDDERNWCAEALGGPCEHIKTLGYSG
jgi:hypothetical protein